MATRTLALPALDGALDVARAEGGPIVELQLATRFGAPGDVTMLRTAVAKTPLIVAAFGSQRTDGSWGSDDDPRGSVLPTLWMAKSLAELGLDDSHAGWHAAVEFLAGTSHTGHGVLGLDGRDESVLSCYAGIAAEMYLQGGRSDLGRRQIDWILDYQDVSVGGRRLRRDPVATWDERMRTRYGGCLSDTTCLIGLVKTGRALTASLAHEHDARVAELVEAIREVYLERRLMYRSNGEIVPIGVYGAASDRWLLPTFPLDWHTDLIEVLDFVAHAGPPDRRMQPAIDRLVADRLPDGGWPLRLSFRPAALPAPERRSKRRSSPMITLRAASALAASGARPS